MLNFIILYMNGRKNLSRLLFHWKDQYIPVGKQQKSRKNPLQRRRLRRQIQYLGQEVTEIKKFTRECFEQLLVDETDNLVEMYLETTNF